MIGVFTMKSRFTISIFILLILFIVGCTAPETGEEQEEKKILP